jgi:polyferredoxin
VTEFEKVTSVESVAKAGVFISLFAGLVVVLPVMTKKRTQCSFLCPLGAVNTLSNKINPFTVIVNKEKCTECFKCVEVCPLYAISGQDIKDGKISVFCSKCGKCIDACSKSAISYSIRGVEAGKMNNFPRNLFLFVSFLFMSVFSAGAIINTLQSLLSHIF